MLVLSGAQWSKSLVSTWHLPKKIKAVTLALQNQVKTLNVSFKSIKKRLLKNARELGILSPGFCPHSLVAVCLGKR